MNILYSYDVMSFLNIFFNLGATLISCPLSSCLPMLSATQLTFIQLYRNTALYYWLVGLELKRVFKALGVQRLSLALDPIS